MEAMLKPKVTSLPGHIQSTFVQNILKLYAHVVATAEADDDVETVTSVTQLLTEKLPMFVASSDLEVQERVSAGCNVPRYVYLVITGSMTAWQCDTRHVALCCGV